MANSDTGFIQDSQQVTLKAEDTGSGVGATYYTLDGSVAIAYAQPFTVSGVGSHTITYWSVDNLGNKEDVQTGFVNIVPAQALVTLASGLVDNNHSGWQTGAVTVTLTPSGGAGTITTQYRIDGGTWQTYSGPFEVAGSGSHEVDYESADSLGVNEQQNTGYVNIDTTPPATVASGPATPQRSTVVVHFTASDAQSGVAATVYRVDAGAWLEGASAIIAAPTNHKMDGVHVVSYYSVDVAGNVEAVRHFSVTIDTIRPVLSVSAKRIAVHRGGTLKLRYRERDAETCRLLVALTRKVHKHTSKYSYILSTRHVSSWQTFRLRLRLPRGTYAMQLRLCDAAGNLSAGKSMYLTIK